MSPVAEFLEPTAANFRAEIARYKLEQYLIASKMNMNPTLLSHYLTESRSMSQDTAELIASVINELLDIELFQVKIKAQ